VKQLRLALFERQNWCGRKKALVLDPQSLQAEGGHFLVNRNRPVSKTFDECWIGLLAHQLCVVEALRPLTLESAAESLLHQGTRAALKYVQADHFRYFRAIMFLVHRHAHAPCSVVSGLGIYVAAAGMEGADQIHAFEVRLTIGSLGARLPEPAQAIVAGAIPRVSAREYEQKATG